MPVTDLHDRLKVYYDIIDRANGLPVGSTPIGSLTFEQLKDMAISFAKCEYVMRWAAVACTGLLLLEHGEKITKKSFRYIIKGLNSYPWVTIINACDTIDEMLSCKATIDVTASPDVAHLIFKGATKRASHCTPPEKKLLWDIARGRGYTSSLMRKTVRDINELRLSAEKRGVDVVKLCIEAAARRAKLEETRFGQGVADDDNDGERD